MNSYVLYALQWPRDQANRQGGETVSPYCLRDRVAWAFVSAC